MSDLEGPDVLEATCDRHGLVRLATDLRERAEILGVKVRDARGKSRDDATAADAVAMLGRGDARAVQVRYRFDGVEQVDTILATATGFRVIRASFGGGTTADARD